MKLYAWSKIKVTEFDQGEMTFVDTKNFLRFKISVSSSLGLETLLVWSQVSQNMGGLFLGETFSFLDVIQ